MLVPCPGWATLFWLGTSDLDLSMIYVIPKIADSFEGGSQVGVCWPLTWAHLAGRGLERVTMDRVRLGFEAMKSPWGWRIYAQVTKPRWKPAIC